jgi:hypothetical protein
LKNNRAKEILASKKLFQTLKKGPLSGFSEPVVVPPPPSQSPLAFLGQSLLKPSEAQVYFFTAEGQIFLFGSSEMESLNGIFSLGFLAKT